MLVLTDPIQQEIAFSKDNKPTVQQKQPLFCKRNNNEKDSIIIEDASNMSLSTSMKKQVARPSNSTKATSKQKPQKVIRTVFMPNEQADTMVLAIEALQATLEDQEALWKEKEAEMEQERQVREQEFKLREDRDRETIFKLKQELDNRNAALEKSTNGMKICKL